MNYPFSRYKFVGFSSALEEIVYTKPCNENYSYRHDGGITKNTHLGYENKLDAYYSKLRTLKNSKEKIKDSLNKVEFEISELENLIDKHPRPVYCTTLNTK